MFHLMTDEFPTKQKKNIWKHMLLKKIMMARFTAMDYAYNLTLTILHAS